MRLTILASALLLLGMIPLQAGCATNASGPGAAAANPSITVFPVRMAGQDRDDVAKLVAFMLEQRGLDTIEVAETVFATDETVPFDDQAAAFADFVQGYDLTTEFAYYAAVVGTPQNGVDEIRGVLVDGNGNVVMADRQTRGDRAMKKAKPSDPMECTMFLVERLGDHLDLAKPDPDREGRWARHWKSDSLVPEDAELDAMEARAKRLRRTGSSATVLVFPARIGDSWSVECAHRLAAEINRRGFLAATVAETPIEFEVEPSRNQQHVLWSGARSIRDLVRAEAPNADYVLVADYVVAEGRGAHAVHTFLLDADGNWVMVDFQNSHHGDFNRIGPKTASDCCDLSVTRLGRFMRS
ncbi:MAG: hypothetical protein ACYTGP_11045 [Planctomycetota bacterium]|jgi:hypothetical protein